MRGTSALAKAGIMEGKSATMYTWDDGIKELEKYGAKYVDEDIVVSENIVTEEMLMHRRLLD